MGHYKFYIWHDYDIKMLAKIWFLVSSYTVWQRILNTANKVVKMPTSNSSKLCSFSLSIAIERRVFSAYSLLTSRLQFSCIQQITTTTASTSLTFMQKAIGQQTSKIPSSQWYSAQPWPIAKRCNLQASISASTYQSYSLWTWLHHSRVNWAIGINPKKSSTYHL